MSSIYDVRQFHDRFHMPRLSRPGFLTTEQQQVRLNFLLEELLETASSCGFELVMTKEGTVGFERTGEMEGRINLAEAFDGLLDLTYVALGTADLMGLGGPANIPGPALSIWWEGWRRVHRANMAKVPVKSAADSKRGTTWDVKKPQGWKAPTFDDLLK